MKPLLTHIACLAMAAACWHGAGLASGRSQPAARPPSILLILADDMGYGDVGAFNPAAKTRTPHLDRLASEGIRLTDAHAPGSVCVPSRYGLLTGRYPFRNSRRPAREAVIEPDRLTVPALLRERGYATAMVGKWHLGFDGGDRFDYAKPLRGGPVDRGFDSFFGMHASLDIPPYFWIEDDRAVEVPTRQVAASSTPGWSPIQGAFWRAGPVAPGFRHEEVLLTLTRKAAEYLEARRGETTPFFLYLALTAPHTPWLPAEPYRGRGGAGLYGEFVAHTDAAVGQVLAALDRSGRAGETLVLFTSDNGPVWYPADAERTGHRATHVYRGMKGDAWEGGHRMPFIARWPGRIVPGSAGDATVCFTDLLATFAALTGAALPQDAGEDSFNILPVLRGAGPGAGPPRDVTLHHSSRGVLAVRQGEWKLIPAPGSGGFSPGGPRAAPGEPAGQLYNLARDPGERENLYARRPEVVRRLSELLDRCRREGRSRPRTP